MGEPATRGARTLRWKEARKVKRRTVLGCPGGFGSGRRRLETRDHPARESRGCPDA